MHKFRQRVNTGIKKLRLIVIIMLSWNNKKSILNQIILLVSNQLYKISSYLSNYSTALLYWISNRSLFTR